MQEADFTFTAHANNLNNYFRTYALRGTNAS